MTSDLKQLTTLIAKQSDVKAFRNLYDILFDKLFAFALQYTKSREVAEEVISDVFLKVWKKRGDLLSIDNMETYMYVAVRNQCYTYIKRQLNRPQEQSLSEHDDLYFAVENFTPEKAFLSEEMRKQLDEAIELLPSTCKVAFLLVKENGMSYKEAAAILEISPNTVKNHIIAAIKKIREHLLLTAENERKKVALQRWIHVVKISLLIVMIKFF